MRDEAINQDNNDDDKRGEQRFNTYFHDRYFQMKLAQIMTIDPIHADHLHAKWRR